MTSLEKELMEALESVSGPAGDGGRCWCSIPSMIPYRGHDSACLDARLVLARAKQTGTHEFTVTDDGHGRAMVGGRRLAWGGMGVSVGESIAAPGLRAPVNVGTRVRVELRDGCDFATLVEVL